jgi:hypothetical protein
MIVNPSHLNARSSRGLEKLWKLSELLLLPQNKSNPSGPGQFMRVCIAGPLAKRSRIDAPIVEQTEREGEWLVLAKNPRGFGRESTTQAAIARMDCTSSLEDSTMANSSRRQDWIPNRTNVPALALVHISHV